MTAKPANATVALFGNARLFGNATLINPTSPPTVTVIDALMGQGKTTYAMDMIKDRHAGAPFSSAADEERPKFIYIVVNLKEVERVKMECVALDMTDPVAVEGRKLNHLEQLVREGRNIVSTHQLFRLLNQSIYKLLQDHNYVLIIDEVLECVKQFTITKDDIRTLFAQGDDAMVYADDRNRLRWNHKAWSQYSGKFNEVRDLCDNGNLVWFRGAMLMWEFPSEFLAAFSETYILTYLFLGSPMAFYFQANGVGYTMKSIKDGELVDYDAHDNTQAKTAIRSLLTIIDSPSLNAPGTKVGRGHPLSKSWYERHVHNGRPDADIDRLRRCTQNYFQHVVGTPTSVNMWTTFKPFSKHMKGKGYARGFVSCNAKATNDFIENRSLAYLINTFCTPVLKGYFEEMGVDVREDLHALSEMIQWIWRSQIRRGDPVTIYLPSERMRAILKAWLNTSDAALVRGGARLDVAAIAA